MASVPQIKLRTVIGLVALIAVGLGSWLEYSRRAGKYRRLADLHAARASSHREKLERIRESAGGRFLAYRAKLLALEDYHEQLSANCREASRRPWSSPPPDPTPPEIDRDPDELRKAVMQLVTRELRDAKRLHFDEVSLTDAEFVTLCDLAGLEELSLRGPYLSFEGLMALKVLPNLKKLNLIDCVTPEEGRGVAKALRTVLVTY